MRLVGSAVGVVGGSEEGGVDYAFMLLSGMRLGLVLWAVVRRGKGWGCLYMFLY
jgi:hypothetical protein